MCKSKIFLLLTLCLIGYFTAYSVSLTLVKEIGDTNGVIIHRPNGVVVTAEKDIFVADSKQHYLAKFNWDGKLIKKIGQLGQGPKDLNTPVELSLYANRLYLHDSGNKRFMEIGFDLEEPVYKRFTESIPFIVDFSVLDETKFVYVSCSREDKSKYNAITIMDTSSNNRTTFFDQLPQGVTAKEEKISSSTVNRLFFAPVFAVDYDKKNLVISFKSPGNPIEFFIFSFDGKCLDTFEYVFDKDYHLPDFLREGKKPPKDLKFTRIFIRGIFVYEGYYVAFISKTKFRGKRGHWPDTVYLYDSVVECVVFDKITKKLKARFHIPDFEIFSLNKQGLLSAFGHDEEENSVVQIYQLKL